MRRSAEPKAFRGPFALHLLDLVRSIRRAKQTLKLELASARGEMGAIYFQKGELIHAEFRGKFGEEAFEALIAQRDGKYTRILGQKAEVISIERDIRTLLADYKDRQGQLTTLWSPPPAPARGFQEEAWMQDWGEGTEGFIAARIIRNDCTTVMKAIVEGAEPLNPKELVFVAEGLAKKLDPSQSASVRLDMGERLAFVAPLSAKYFLVVELDSRKADPQTCEHRLVPLIEALKDSLEHA